MPNDIWVLAEHQEGKVKKITFELLSAGVEFSKKTGQKVATLLLGTGLEEAVKSLTPFTDEIYLLDDTSFTPYTSESYLTNIASLVREHQPSILLGGATSTGKDLFPRLAMHLQTGYAPDCTGLSMGEDGKLVAKRPLYGGKVFAEMIFSEARPQMATVRNNTFLVNDKVDKSAKVISIVSQMDPSATHKKVIGFEKAAGAKLDITEADIVVAAGRGIKAPENFKIMEDLAEVLKGSVGTTRATVDEGWRDLKDQIGKSGKNISAKLYMAFGISGAIHHVLGITTCKTVVAVDNDPNALIFNYADYGIVGDLFQIAPALTEELKKLFSSE
ncbi:MAG: electron transfer flavoprotein subunit alpha/FixB family protein [Deltaproteobacteria bacterium]|nr:electron transfer flavoprotein subunit alpha/FixB family protein [Deltaproteobacteria bacterium]MBM4322232.1 electron transfer flavoprotein subunit alpha/FixB family protein [Deltaproteobacteria bacterium]MBM4347600.1 electron transfer flavoprotein subunit alpha/FixB family protein [Deltaproteobacteria bacterium]